MGVQGQRRCIESRPCSRVTLARASLLTREQGHCSEYTRDKKMSAGRKRVTETQIQFFQDDADHVWQNDEMPPHPPFVIFHRPVVYRSHVGCIIRP